MYEFITVCDYIIVYEFCIVQKCQRFRGECQNGVRFSMGSEFQSSVRISGSMQVSKECANLEKCAVRGVRIERVECARRSHSSYIDNQRQVLAFIGNLPLDND